MISLLQRVRQARVEVDGQVVGAIGAGLLVLVCAERGDTEAEADKLLAKMLKLRIFSDDAGKMNKSVQDLDGQGGVGGLLLVSQFTLAADTTGGNRPSFTQAAAPDEGRRLYDYLVAQAPGAPPPGGTGGTRSAGWASPSTRARVGRTRFGPPDPLRAGRPPDTV